MDISPLLTAETQTRLDRIKIFKKEKAAKIESSIVDLYKKGLIKRQITLEEFERIVAEIDHETENVSVNVSRRRGDLDL